MRAVLRTVLRTVFRTVLRTVFRTVFQTALRTVLATLIEPRTGHLLFGHLKAIRDLSHRRKTLAVSLHQPHSRCGALCLSEKPSAKPSEKPSKKPSEKPSKKPSEKLSEKPSEKPFAKPYLRPSVCPSVHAPLPFVSLLSPDGSVRGRLRTIGRTEPEVERVLPMVVSLSGATSLDPLRERSGFDSLGQHWPVAHGRSERGAWSSGGR